MGINFINIQICDDPSEAPKYGEEYGYLELEKAVIIGNGTVEGNPSVDLILIDKQGKRHVAMTTGRLLESLGQAVKAKATSVKG